MAKDEVYDKSLSFQLLEQTLLRIYRGESECQYTEEQIREMVALCQKWGREMDEECRREEGGDKMKLVADTKDFFRFEKGGKAVIGNRYSTGWDVDFIPYVEEDYGKEMIASLIIDDIPDKGEALEVAKRHLEGSR